MNLRLGGRNVSTLLAGLVAAFVAVELAGFAFPELRRSLVYWFAFHSGHFRLAPVDPHVLLTLLTHAFLHGGWLHVAFNSLILLHLGAIVVARMGSLRFLTLFLLTAAAGALAHALVPPLDWTFAVGASGSVFGVAAARAWILSEFQPGGPGGRLRYLATQAVGWMVANALIYVAGYLHFLNLGGGGIAWKAHVGGYAAGAALAPLLAPRGSGLRGPTP